ncbi:hypothetical protein ACFQH6_13155 [Halobacteriaceae archaeon GCM10025711]
MVDPDTLLASFVQSADAPTGDWWLDVPVGYVLEEQAGIVTDGTDHVDAVCLVSRDPDPPERYRFNRSGVEFVDESKRPSGRRGFRNVAARTVFDGETAVLVVASPGPPDMTGIGRLVAYRELIRDNWNVDVAGLVLLARGSDRVVERACKRLGVDVVRPDVG